MTDADRSGLVAIVPAAGASRRFGRPKQLVEIGGTPLLARCVARLAPVCDSVLVVLGAHADRVRAALPPTATSVVNDAWCEGLGTSLACAAASLPASCRAALIAMPDQPGVTTAHFAALAARWRAAPEHVVCAVYEGTRGVPAIVPARLFAALRALSGRRGAHALIAADARLIGMPLAQAAIDIDTPADLGRADRQTATDADRP